MAKQRGKAAEEQASPPAVENNALPQVETIEGVPPKVVGYLASSAKVGRAVFFPLLPGFAEHGPLWDFKRRLARTEEQWVGYVVMMYPLGGLVLGPFVDTE